jgi:small subunit ribosomal protein S2
MFVIDLNKEHIAVAEAKRLGIAVIAIADTNTNPEVVDYPIPGNDDAIRSIKLFANMIADSFNQGAESWQEEMKKQADKRAQEPVAKEERQERAPKAPAEGGPAVFKFSKGRKLVAAGTADEVEIEMELESGETAAPAETENTEE